TRQRSQRVPIPAGGPALGRGAGGGLWGSPPPAPPVAPRGGGQRPPSYTAPQSEPIFADESAPSTPPAEAEPVALQPGDRVMHRLFGDGIVLKVSENGGSTSVVVTFTRAGKKELDLAFAKLQKI